jgi:PrtD family type I secretion system ABC transporter
MLLLGCLSAVVAALQFVVPLYMMAVYNRILQTGSIETLKLITIIAAVLLLVMGIAESARSRILAMMANRVGHYLNQDVYQVVLASPSSVLSQAIQAEATKNGADQQIGEEARSQVMLDLRQVSNFIASGALNTFFDAILAPIFILALFLLHPLLGWIGVGAALVILCLAFLAEILARSSNLKIAQAEGRAQAKVERSIGQFDAVASMGIAPRLYAKWEMDRREAMQLSLRSQSLVGTISGLARAVRLVVQVAVLGVGAWLALTTNGFLAGAIIAASIILSRALAPIDQSIAVWQRFIQARVSARRLVRVIDAVDSLPGRMNSPAPKAELVLSQVTLAFPGQRNAMLQDASLSIQGGHVLGILGPVGTGKTTLLRAIAGLHRPKAGSIQLGTIPVDAMTDTDRMRDLGYLPQDIQLLPGSIADNISRFSDGLDREPKVFEAAEKVGASGFVQGLSDGFMTEFQSERLSAGQTQLIGLARVIYDNPLLVLLDEPTANLDQQGKQYVADLIGRRQLEGTLTVFVSHDRELLSCADTLLYLNHGVAKYGKVDEILRFISASGKQVSGQTAVNAPTEVAK